MLGSPYSITTVGHNAPRRSRQEFRSNNNNHQRVVQTTNRWAAEVEDSESSEDEGRVVKTMKVSKCFEKIPLDVDAFVMWTRMWKHGLSAVACRKHQSHFSFGAVPMRRWLLLL